MLSPLGAYRRHGHESVNGWLAQGAVDTICEVAAIQESSGIQGPVCEIGVHEGRLFILLHLLAARNERSLAIDLFDMQDENVDQSGMGSRDQLLKNLRAHGCDLGRVVLRAENSLRVAPGDILELAGGQPRLFSIDGGHTAEATANDLLLAHDTVCHGGVVILDDYFNPSWPGVSEGVCGFMRDKNAALVPVAITANKFLFAKGEAAAERYRTHLMQTRFGAKTSLVFGHDVVCFERPMMRQRLLKRAVANPVWQGIRDTRIGDLLRVALRRWK